MAKRRRSRPHEKKAPKAQTPRQVDNHFMRLNQNRNHADVIDVEVRPRDLARAYSAAVKYTGYENTRSRSEWIGATDAECQTMTERGDIAQVAAAQEFADEVNQRLDVETSAPELMSTVAGGAVSVPTLRTGNPRCFRRPAPVMDTRKPLRIFVDVGASAGIDSETIAKRGKALLALAQLLSKSRPVELIGFFYGEIRGEDFLVKIPLGLGNWAFAGAVLGHSAFLREPCFRFIREAAGFKGLGSIGWGRGYSSGESVQPSLLGAKKNDVIFGRAFLHNRDFTTDPVGWVAKEIERINAEQKA